MTVYKIGRNKIKIALTDREVLSFFGAYEKITSMTGNTRLTVGLLLKESLAEYENELDGELLVEVRAKENFGCVITVSPAEALRRQNAKAQKMFEFSNSDTMISGVTRLYKSRRSHMESSLYKMPRTYRLIISVKADSDYIFMNEFCLRQSDSPAEVAYTEEYGTLIVKNDAVAKIGKAFSKSF